MFTISSFLSFAALSSSAHYNLNNYSIGQGGADNSSSTTYHLQGTVGEQANGNATTTGHKVNSGSIQAQQLSVPQAPTLSNGSNLYYNKLLITLNDNAGTNSYPTDVTFAIEESTSSGFSSPNWVQASGALGGSPVFQTYTAWGGAGGSFITGLNYNTAYWVKVSAMQGQFTNTAYGQSQTATTATPSMTFSVSPSSMALGNIIPNASPVVSSNLSFTFATNGATGGAVYISGSNSGLNSPTQSHTIAAYTGNLAAQSEGFGVQATNPSQTSGGPLATVSPFNGTSNTVGAENTSEQQFFNTAAAIVGGTGNANLQAKSSLLTPVATDYAEVLTFVAAGNF
jgi:hypothetical protein